MLDSIGLAHHILNLETKGPVKSNTHVKFVMRCFAPGEGGITTWQNTPANTVSAATSVIEASCDLTNTETI